MFFGNHNHREGNGRMSVNDVAYENIIARSWFCLFDGSLRIGSLMSGNGIEKILGVETSKAYGIEPTQFSFWGDEEGNFVEISGCKLSDSSRFIPFLDTWMKRMMRKERPAFFFSRRKSDMSELHTFFATSCPDLVFGCSVFREHAILYKNNDTASIILQLPEMPAFPTIRREWMSWSESRIILGSSLRYFLERNPDSGMLLLHTLGIDSESMVRIKRSRFEWSRTAQCWTGDPDVVDVADVLELIRLDSAPSPDSMGCVPEWYANLIHEGRIRKRHVAKGDDSAIWRILFGVQG